MGSGLETAISVCSPRDGVTHPPYLPTDSPALVIKREARRRVHPFLLVTLSPPQSLRSPWPGRLGFLSWVAKALSLGAININKLHGSGLNYLLLIVAQPKIELPATQASKSGLFGFRVWKPLQLQVFCVVPPNLETICCTSARVKIILRAMRLSLRWVTCVRGILSLPNPEPGTHYYQRILPLSFS